MTMHYTAPLQDYQAAMESVVLFDISSQGKIELQGRDARMFLHNLCTQDINHLPVGSDGEAFLTTAKARVIAYFWVGHDQTEQGSVLILDMAPGLADKVYKHLNHYLISEQVEIADRTQELAMLRMMGPKSSTLLANLFASSLAELKFMQHTMIPGVGTVRRQALLGGDGFDLFCPATKAGILQNRLIQAGAIPGSAATYDCLRIEAGLPEYGKDIDEQRLAMEVGRTTQAISYTKGCYLGQETIVMARDRGQVNRMLMGVQVDSGTPLQSGIRLFRKEEEVGQTTSSVFSPRHHRVLALAYVRRGHCEPGTELVIEPTTDGRIAVVCSLPFGGKAGGGSAGDVP